MLVSIRLEDYSSSCRKEIVKAISDPDVLLELAQSDDFDVVEAVASNLYTPASVLSDLAYDEHSTVKIAVAGNPHTPPEDLDILADDSRAASKVASNPNAWESTLLRIGSRYQSIYTNPNIPDSILNDAILKIDDQYTYIISDILELEKATLGFDLFSRLAKSPYIEVRQALGQCKRTPSDILSVLAMDRDSRVRRNVASNPSTPKQTLKAMADDQDDYVCYGLAKNPSTPPKALSHLVAGSRTYWPDVKEAVAHNSNTPQATLKKLAKTLPSYVASNPSAPYEVLLTLSDSPDCIVRISLAENPKCPDDIKDKLLHDDNYRVRLALSHNPTTSLFNLLVLTNDSNVHVSFAAKQRMKERSQD